MYYFETLYRYNVVDILNDGHVFWMLACKFQFPINIIIELYAKRNSKELWGF